MAVQLLSKRQSTSLLSSSGGLYVVRLTATLCWFSRELQMAIAMRARQDALAMLHFAHATGDVIARNEHSMLLALPMSTDMNI